MRNDMFKVIVERPRLYKGGWDRARARRDDVDGPMFLGMRAGYSHRALNENLVPLRRFLQSQVGRPWNKVMSELRENIDSRSTVKQHILEHIDDFVAQRVWREDGKVWSASRYSGVPRTLDDPWEPPLYVDPRTGILRQNKFAPSRAAWRREHMKRDEEKATSRHIISETVQLLLLDGIWYRVVVAPLPALSPKPTRRDRWAKGRDCRWDAVRNALVSRRDDHDFRGNRELGNYRLFGPASLYAVSKQQLNNRELRDFGLRSPDKDSK